MKEETEIGLLIKSPDRETAETILREARSLSGAIVQVLRSRVTPQEALFELRLRGNPALLTRHLVRMRRWGPAVRPVGGIGSISTPA